MLKIDEMATQKVSIFDVFWLFLAKWSKRVTYLSTESHGTAYQARPSYQDPKSSIGIEKCWKLTKWRPKSVDSLRYFGQISKTRSLNMLIMASYCFIQLDLLARIRNLQSESKNVEIWRNGGILLYLYGFL